MPPTSMGMTHACDPYTQAAYQVAAFRQSKAHQPVPLTSEQVDKWRSSYAPFAVKFPGGISWQIVSLIATIDALTAEKERLERALERYKSEEPERIKRHVQKVQAHAAELLAAREADR